MAIPTLFDVQHKCGHTQERDLSDKAAGERAGFVAWLAQKPCTDCWKKRQDRKVSKEMQTERAALEEQALEDQERSELPILVGSAKQTSLGFARPLRAPPRRLHLTRRRMHPR